jgi:hypothetical protein
MKITYRIHAIQRMFERGVTAADMRSVLEHGTTIEEYEDTHYPARLVLGRAGKRPLHLVAADNAADDEAIVVTVYEPASAHWQPGFEHRKP